MYVSLNVNERVIAKLTPKGLAHLKAFYEKLRPGSSNNIPWLDGETLRTELWDLMHIFGPQMYMSNDPMFENNSIQINMGAD